MSTPEQQKRKTGRPDEQAKRAEPKPIKPLEPLDNTQPEIPKVGTTDAPGG
jgi:hypothetical protein